MKTINQANNWLGNRMAGMSDVELSEMFSEIADFRKTGILKGDKLRDLAKEFSDNVSRDEYSLNMRLVEDEVLFEMRRRFYNAHLQA